MFIIDCEDTATAVSSQLVAVNASDISEISSSHALILTGWEVVVVAGSFLDVTNALVNIHTDNSCNIYP